jgi:hypothetical protein
MRQIQLSEILPTDAVDALTRLFAKKRHPTVSDVRVITAPHADALLAQGIDADYLAYAILYSLNKVRP